MNPYPPNTISYAVAALVLEQIAAERWVTDAQIVAAIPAAKPNLIAKVRARLREEGLIGYKGALSPWPHRRNVRAVVVLLAMLLLVTPAAAQGARPWERPNWQLGAYDRGVGPTWYWRFQQDGTHPVVETVPPGLGWGLCPGPMTEPQQCIVSAQGPWVRITANGQILAERGRVYLPTAQSLGR